jgi:hypothetical protein
MVVNTSEATAAGGCACAATQGLSLMKFQSSTSIGGSVPVPHRSATRVKVAFHAQQRPPTLDDIFEAVKAKRLMGSEGVVKLFEEVIVPKGGIGQSTSTDFHRHVEQFNFGALHTKDIREAEKEGHEFIKHGLFQLPYPVCLYRCQVHYEGETPLGIALLLVDGKWGEEHDPEGGSRTPGYATVAFTHSLDYMTAMHSINTMNWRDQPDGTAIQIEVPRVESDYWTETTDVEGGKLDLKDMAEGSLLAIGLTMILNTKNVRKERCAPPEKPNKARAAKGRPLLPWVTKVYTSVYNRAVQPGEGSHASPRPHRRRAHVRHYPATAYREAYVRPIAAMLVNWDGKPLERGQYEVHGDD